MPEVAADQLGTVCSQLATLEQQKDELEAELAEIKASMDAKKQTAMTIMQQSGVTSVKANGMNVYLRRELWAGAKDGDKERAIAALRAAGLDQLVFETFNTQSLSKHVRDLERDGNDMPVLPPELADAINVAEKFDIRVTKA